MCFLREKDFTGKIFDSQTTYNIIVDDNENISNITSSTMFTCNLDRIQITRGVYIFVMTKDIRAFNPDKFNKISCKNIPPLGSWENGQRKYKYNLKKGQIFYIGSNENDCDGRCFQHINCSTDTGNANLRLAYKRRKFIKKYLRVLFIDCSISQDEKVIEKNIRKTYFSFFGR
ncbi:MAG: hypothetical protein IKA88_05980 [Clostridia bacterium]|nr:hypothetical protein [Clostridia bacterium]